MAVSAFFRRSGYSAEEIDDLTQEVFLRICSSIRDYRGDGLAAWVMTITRNVHLERQRRLHADKRRHQRAPLADASLVEDAMDTHSEVSTRQIASRIVAAANRLPKLERECLRHRSVHQLSYREIARVVGVSSNAVREALRRARQKLRGELGRGD